MKKTIIIALIISFVCIILAGCGDSASRLVGKWEPSGDTEGDVIEFFSDGTVVLDEGQMSGTYTAEDGRLVMRFLWAALSYDYEINGSNLTLINEDGVETYQRQ